MDNRSREEFGRQAAAMATAPAFQDETALLRIVSAMALTLDQRVLEIACGPGIVAQAVAPVIGMIPGLMHAHNGYKSGGLKGGVVWGVDAYTGYSLESKTFNAEHMKYGLYPLAGGIIASMLASKLGLNKYVSRIPIVGKKIKI